MREQLEERLKTLKAELTSGEQMLTELETKRATLRDTLLRISGAIQVLEEELARAMPALGQGDAKDVQRHIAPHGDTGRST